MRKKEQKILEFISVYGGIDGADHKQWVLDNIVRMLIETPEEYEKWVKDYQQGDEGPETYEWDKGVAP